MDRIYQQEPRLIHRFCGGWIARSSREDSLQIGVLASTPDEAVEKFAATLQQWRVILAGEPAKGEA